MELHVMGSNFNWHRCAAQWAFQLAATDMDWSSVVIVHHVKSQYNYIKKSSFFSRNISSLESVVEGCAAWVGSGAL